MVLPKAIGLRDSDRLLDELLYAWKHNDEEIAFPSDEWFDELWIHVPSQRSKMRDILSDLMGHVDEYLQEQHAREYICHNDYDKISFSDGYLCIHKT